MTTKQSKMGKEKDAEGLADPVNAVEKYVDDFLARRPLPGNLREAVRYAMFGGGKRIRPTLVIRCCQAVGGSMADALAAGGALELVHCFSLVHDDLPAMDDDDLRRGRPTLHKHANEAMAILAGDAMSGLAFELIAQRVTDGKLAAGLLRELAIGTNDMIAGQVWDTLPDFAADVPALKRLQTIHKNKTGALIRCACRMGGMCGGVSEGQLEALTRFGDAIGLMFQVVDDILDVTQTTEQLGKSAGKDEKQGKLTYPAVMGLDASRAEVARLGAEAKGALAELSKNGRSGAETQVGLTALEELGEYLMVRMK
ncbi:MAG: polyprenyl synthetase family protein [Phycisphaeraceae bacterium]|nr:polyprenyl synthetase family protein [Phycisphaeraceae bacterium]